MALSPLALQEPLAFSWAKCLPQCCFLLPPPPLASNLQPAASTTNNAITQQQLFPATIQTPQPPLIPPPQATPQEAAAPNPVLPLAAMTTPLAASVATTSPAVMVPVGLYLGPRPRGDASPTETPLYDSKSGIHGYPWPVPRILALVDRRWSSHQMLGASKKRKLITNIFTWLQGYASLVSALSTLPWSPSSWPISR